MAKIPKTPSVNDARRLLGLIERAGKIAGATPATDGWITVVGLSVDGLTNEDKITLAYETVTDFRRLLDRVETRYGEISTSDGFKSVINRFRVVANGQYVHGAWDAIQRQFYAEQNVVVLETIADALPNDGAAPQFEAVQAILSDVEALLKEVAESDLPPYHKRYAEMMLERLRASLRNYVMFGAQSVHEYSLFLEGLAGDMSANSVSMKGELAEISTAGQSLIDRVKQKATQVTEISKSVYYIGGAAAMLYHGGEKALPFLLPFFGGK